ncbi:MAG: DUF4198 domain-containing protein [Chitinophagaceae bacterium]
MRQKTILLLITCVIVVSLFAHEYIILAAKYVVKKGEKFELRLFVADGFNIEAERSFQTKITKNFQLVTNKGSNNLLKETSENNVQPTFIESDFDGLAIIHTERDYAYITLDAEKFKAYLKEDNIDNIHLSASENKPQRERYTRYLKCLIQSNFIKNDTLYKKEVGQNFEIVLLSNPYLKKLGEPIQAQVFFQGKPLANKTITARNRIGNLPATVQKAVTNNMGICTFKINRKGEWFIHATHMITCEDKKEADWESFWTSFSFGLE